MQRSSVISALQATSDPGLLAIMHVHAGFVRAVAFSLDGRTLASASDDRTIRLWDTRTHKQRGRPLTGHTGATNSVALSRDGHTLASGSDDETIRLWDTRTHKQRGRPLTGHTRGFVNSVAFSPDGRTLAAARYDGTIRLWDTRTHKQTGELARTRASSVMAFSPDGNTLATNDDNAIRLLDVHTHKPLDKRLVGQTASTFSPDGRRLVVVTERTSPRAGSGRHTVTIRLWDARAPQTG